MRLWWRFLWAFLALASALGPLFSTRPVYAVQACPDRAYELIQLVNNLRASLGLPAYEIHPTVMAVAQAHSEYQASIDTLTHEGPGGSRPKDRLRAAGYGNGGNILVSENIAWGYNMPPQGAMDLWLPSAIHYYTMTIPNVRHVGAGCATSATGKTYYTLLAAWHSGAGSGPPPPPPPTSPPRPTATPTGPTPTPTPVPVIPATPRPDGAVIHVVQPGQTLMMIALSYQVPLEQILEQNNLTRTSIIYPGDEIVIVPPRTTPTPTPTSLQPTKAISVTPSGGASPVASPSPTPSFTATATPTATHSEASLEPAVPGGPGLPPFWVFLLTVGGWVLMVGLGWALVTYRSRP